MNKLLQKIQRLRSLTLSVKEECDKILQEAPATISNKAVEIRMQIENAYQELNYLISKLEDAQEQGKNEPLIIQKEDK